MPVLIQSAFPSLWHVHAYRVLEWVPAWLRAKPSAQVGPRLHCLPLSLNFSLSRLRSSLRCRRGRLASFVRRSMNRLTRFLFNTNRPLWRYCTLTTLLVVLSAWGLMNLVLLSFRIVRMDPTRYAPTI